MKMRFNHVTLLSTPWPLFNRPSIQLGTLKAYLESRFPDLKVINHHIYLKIAEDIGYKLYHEISQRTWLSEAIYAAMLFPERKAAIEKVFIKEAMKNRRLLDEGFHSIVEKVRTVSDAFINRVRWDDFGLAGFSISLCQLTSALYFIKRIRRLVPQLPIVIGGSQFSGSDNRNLLRDFLEIDYVVNGEGEIPLASLVKALREGANPGEIDAIPGLVSGQSVEKGLEASFSQMEDIGQLPTPDFNDYFDLMQTFPQEKRFFPKLSVEASRGCNWHRSGGKKGLSGCAFCNLNLQWSGYRWKPAPQVVSDIETLSSRHKILSVAFMDNMLPVRASGEIFEKLAGLGKDFRFFGELRASTRMPLLEKMRKAGMREVQIGIEALSSRLLKKLSKGTSVIQNIEIMKNCEALGIENVSNLIVEFPGSDENDVNETLRNLEFTSFFRPLKTVRFWLGAGSPVFRNPDVFGIRATYNHPNYGVLFPPEIHNSNRFMIQSYRGDREFQKKLWKPVVQRVKAWAETYSKLHLWPSAGLLLTFRDGRDFLIIKEKRAGEEPFKHRLEGNSRKIYLFCQKHRSMEKIMKQFSDFTESTVKSFLRMMVRKKLMFEEEGRFLSLAVPVDGGFHS